MSNVLPKFSVHDVLYPMIFEENRLKSFTNVWPFDDRCVCTAEKMAAAGFYHCPTPQAPDSVPCYSCLIDLHDWDANDDPWKEHYNHTISTDRECEFMKFGKPQSELTVEQFMHTVKGRHLQLIKNASDQNLKQFDRMCSKVQQELSQIQKMFNK